MIAEFAERVIVMYAGRVAEIGPVREVEQQLVLEVAFDGVARSTRHKSGVSLRFPRVNRIRTDKPAAEADTVDNLLRLVS